MTRTCISMFRFPYSCMEVWAAVGNGEAGEDFKFTPMTDEEYEEARAKALQSGQMLARVTENTPGVRCAYTLKGVKFDVDWSAEFTTAGDDECSMKLKEVYHFHSVGTYVLFFLFVRLGKQQKAFRDEILRRLKNS